MKFLCLRYCEEYPGKFEMFLELKLDLWPNCLSLLRTQDLADLGNGLAMPTGDEPVAVSVEFCAVSKATLSLWASRRERRVVIIVSPALIEVRPNAYKASPLAMQLLEHSWNEGIVLGLVGVVHGEPKHVAGLDCVLGDQPFTPQALRNAVQKVASRLWFKLPPWRKAPSSATEDAFEAQQITCEEHFRQSLELRYLVYNALGYLDERITSASQKIDLDCYDPMAIHYAVTSRNSRERVVGTMRLIVPGRRNLPHGTTLFQPASYGAWCEQLANAETKRVFRDVLNRPSANSLPLLDSFDYFAALTDQTMFRDMVMPNQSCEVSRVVVHPDFRGNKILKLLVDKAIAVASRIRKRYLLLECAPFHEAMYRKYGFQTIEDQGRRFYARAQKLDSWAVAMYLDLNLLAHKSELVHAQAAKGLYQLRILDRYRRDYTLTVGCKDLDRLGIDSRLSVPYPILRSEEPRNAYVAKSAAPTLSSLIHQTFVDLDIRMGQLMHELFRRLPQANVKLIRGDGNELSIDAAHCQHHSGTPLLREKVSAWLEGRHVST
ncbi:MAG: GNAT family N-acetyltransferase [Gammaproteobacteria bacterium]|nr:GNAT family N-acetyltransferase [Gammaproteobacteria bacterium]